MKSVKSLFFLCFFTLIAFSSFALDKIELKRVEPMNWWVGMKNPHLQLLVNGLNISGCNVQIDYPGVRVESITKVKSLNYLFIDLYVDPTTKAGAFDILFLNQGKKIATYKYQLLERESGSANRAGFNSSDAIYLLMPDRFANGDPSNDNVSGFLETANRNEGFGRHGGDLKGVSNNLDYITNMGFTALWLNPVLENNLKQVSYHGYAITDFYHVDARLGTNEDFKILTQKCKSKGVKMIMDMVFNHIGENHWWMNDLPMEDWINTWPTFTRSYYRLSTVSDPNAAIVDRDRTVKGWFDNPMPDLNLQNRFLQTYLIQNSIWWIEYAGLQGIRMDTYPYPDRVGMSLWGKAVRDEYPNFNIVGECWISSPAKAAFYQAGFPHKDGFDSNLPSVTDFPLHDAMTAALNEPESWDNGLIKIYNVFSEDFLYADPNNLVVFPDNHDISRIYSVVKKDVSRMKMALTLMATVRGIPQFYYGTELLMEGDGGNHATLRVDFPGGWKDDKVNSFTEKGRTTDQNDMVEFISKLLNYRKNEPVLHTGKFTQFLPQDGIYVYSRSLADKAVVVFMNNNDSVDMAVDTSRFSEIMKGFSNGRDVIADKKIADLTMIHVPAKSAVVVELTK